MTTWGGFALIIFAIIIPPIVMLHRYSRGNRLDVSRHLSRTGYL